MAKVIFPILTAIVPDVKSDQFHRKTSQSPAVNFLNYTINAEDKQSVNAVFLNMLKKVLDIWLHRRYSLIQGILNKVTTWALFCLFYSLPSRFQPVT